MQRRGWTIWQRYTDPELFVFLDETGASTNMVRRYGWGPKGERLVDDAPFGYWKTTTFIAGLRSSVSLRRRPPYSRRAGTADSPYGY